MNFYLWSYANPVRTITIEFTTTLAGTQEVINMLVSYGNSINVPFLLVADFQKLLDDYEILLSKLNHSGTLMKYLTNNRLKKTIDQHNVALFKKISEVKQILLALVQSENKRV